MTTITYIEKLLHKELAERDLFLVDFYSENDNSFIVFIDGMENVTLKQCAEVSSLLREKLDDNYDEIEITVSSPGLDSPFKHPNQYKKNINKKVEVLLKDGTKQSGILLDYQTEQLTLQLFEKPKGKDKSKKPSLGNTITILTEQIKYTKKQVTF
ncbi:MAG: hypothetical protein IAE67_09680 [Candidatus Competibacteraceae bacterium]|nr:hypothetical protein [Candidatus Competibacteraceae bacterium]